MGCDIHAVIEYNKHGSYWDFAVVNIDRDYRLFSAIAFGDGGITDELPYPPRGLPPDHSVQVSDLFFMEVDEIRNLHGDSGRWEESKLKEIAESWGDWALQEFSSFGILPNPELHTPGWLNLNELKEALSHAGLRVEDQSPEFRSVIAAMQTLSDDYGAERVRLIFWFDG
jgi:hypothetical protein